MKKFFTFCFTLCLSWPLLAAPFDRLNQGQHTLPDIMPAEIAFVMSVEAVSDSNIRLHWHIAEGTYLYQKQFKFDAEGARLGAVHYPEGEQHNDPYFGDVTIYRGEVTLNIPLLAVSDEGFTLNIGYQGCNDIGFCYPPQTQTLHKDASPEAMGPVTPNVQTRALNVLQESPLGFALLAFLGFGFLLAFTPCVLPMIPILSALIIGEQQHHHRFRAFLLGCTYVLFMALTYALLGAIVASLGAHIQAQLQNPWVLSTTALILLLMAWVLINDKALHALMQMNQSLHHITNKLPNGQFGGVAIMGVISALVISPCVTPPLVGALTYITVSGDVVLGALALFMLAIGMGIPLVAVTWFGTAALPKRGPWMDHVKHFFSLLLILMAISLLSRFLPGYVTLGLWGITAIGVAFWIGFTQAAKTHLERLWKALAWLALIYGTLLIVGASMGHDDWKRPLAGGTTAVKRVESSLPFVTVKTEAELNAALKQAAAHGQPVMLDFYADWCTSCIVMEQTVFSDPRVAEILKPVVLLKVDVTDYNDASKGLMRYWQVFGPPALLFFSPEGQELVQYRIVGDISTSCFLAHLRDWLKTP